MVCLILVVREIWIVELIIYYGYYGELNVECL